MDDPIGDAAMFPTYLLSKVAAQDVKVVLSGEGADEVFAGYPYYTPFAGGSASPPRLDMRLQAEYSQLLRNHLGHSMPMPIPAQRSPYSGFPYMVSFEFAWSMLNLERRPPFKSFVREFAAAEERWLPHSKSHTSLQRALYMDSNVWLTNNLMTKLDRATMAHSLEARVPMLDHRLIEFSFGLPDAFKFREGTGKRIMREAVRSLVPPEILNRGKQGFGVPLDQWFRESLLEFAREHILESSLAEDGVLSRSALEAVSVRPAVAWTLARPDDLVVDRAGWMVARRSRGHQVHRTSPSALSGRPQLPEHRPLTSSFRCMRASPLSAIAFAPSSSIRSGRFVRSSSTTGATRPPMSALPGWLLATGASKYRETPKISGS